MKQVFIAGNWKSNKTIVQTKDWFDNFKLKSLNFKFSEGLKIVLCVPFTLLSISKQLIDEYSLPLELAAQDISPFDSGAYTGEVNALQIKELAEWVIIGHSERRTLFSETDDVLTKKVQQAKTVGLHIIYCVSDADIKVPENVDVVAYEPVWAIGTGKTDTPENANQVIEAIKKKTNISTVIYGGSVTADNVNSFVSMPSIDGVLPGGASLDPEKFYNLILKASSVA